MKGDFMEIKISDGLLYKEAVYEIKKQWLIKEYRPGESIVAFSRRIKADRKTIRTLLGEMGIYNDFQYMDSKCMFCNTTEKIHLHHLHGRKNSNVTIPVCARCHEMFHLFNRQYSSRKN